MTTMHDNDDKGIKGPNRKQPRKGIDAEAQCGQAVGRGERTSHSKATPEVAARVVCVVIVAASESSFNTTTSTTNTTPHTIIIVCWLLDLGAIWSFDFRCFSVALGPWPLTMGHWPVALGHWRTIAWSQMVDL